MGVNKVEYGGETLIDLTEDSVTPKTLMKGVTAHDASGERIVGEMPDPDNLATVDKVKQIHATNPININHNEYDGIAYDLDYGMTNGDASKTYSSGVMYIRIPVRAGENVEFTQDTDGFIKINATSGGSSTPSVSLIGTWTVIDEPEIPKSDLPLEFTSNGTEYSAIGTTSMGSSTWGINALSYLAKDGGYYDAAYTNNPSGSYGITHGWSNGVGYKTITVTKEPTDVKAIAWLGANTDAPKIDTPSKPCFEMPQIRFTSATGSTDNDTTPNLFVDAENPLKLTVEIVGGGALQVGDQLQVCYRKRFNGSMANGFKRKYKLQRFAEYVVTEEDLDKQYLTVSVACEYGSVDKMLHHAYRGLFHDGKAGEIAPLYLRIRRPKGGMQNNDSGQTVNADFSNIVTIWKHSLRGMQTIRIQ